MSHKKDQDTKWSMLMKQAQQGNKQSYQTLLKEINKVLSAFIYLRIKNSSQVDDIVQEILIAIHRARHTYDPERAFTPWMFAIAKHKLIDYLRKSKRTVDKEVSDDTFLENIALIESDDELETLKEQLHNAIEQLPEKQKTTVQLLKIEGYSVKEVSEKTGLSESAVKVTAHRAYKALKKRLIGAVL
jgi:RNA polymerase sigma-70 factor (ECF subfamily)